MAWKHGEGGENGGGETGGGETALDWSLVRRMRDGDPGGLAELWGRYREMVYGHAVRILHNAAEAEDVVAEVFTEVWERAGSYRPERAKPVAWILALVKRRSIDCLRHRQSVLRAEVGLQRETEARGRGDGSRGVEEQVRLSDLRRSLEGMLERLPEAQRKTVELVFYGGMSQKEVARRTATPVGTVKTRLELALRKLRQAMREPPARSGGRVRQGSAL